MLFFCLEDTHDILVYIHVCAYLCLQVYVCISCICVLCICARVVYRHVYMFMCMCMTLCTNVYPYICVRVCVSTLIFFNKNIFFRTKAGYSYFFGRF